MAVLLFHGGSIARESGCQADGRCGKGGEGTGGRGRAGLPLKQIELESPAPVASVAIEVPGDIVLLTHADGAVTHLPVDMWLPGGFTPSTRGVNRRDR